MSHPFESIDRPETSSSHLDRLDVNEKHVVLNDPVMSDRSSKYGSFKISMRSAGHILRGLLEAHYQQELPEIPGHVVAQFMVGIKASRACVPFEFSEDNYVDAHNYLKIAKETDPRHG